MAKIRQKQGKNPYFSTYPTPLQTLNIIIHHFKKNTSEL